jgi:hypothetical protein
VNGGGRVAASLVDDKQTSINWNLALRVGGQEGESVDVDPLPLASSPAVLIGSPDGASGTRAP